MTNYNNHPFIREIRTRLSESNDNVLQTSVTNRIRDIAAILPPSANNNLYDLIIQDVERPLIQYALEQCRGNQIRAAKMLGINRNTLHKKIRTLNIQVKKRKNG